MTHSTKNWIWEHQDYPHFPYNKEKITEKLRKAEYLRGVLAGMLSFAKQEDLDQLEITSITDEIIGTSQIEGECLRRESVKDSVANAINDEYTSTKDLSTKHTDDLTELALDSFRNDEPLSLERLHSWHTAIFANIPAYDDADKITIGTFRDYDEMRVIENLFNRKGKIVKYVAPPQRMIKKDIEALLEYCNSSDEEPYIKSALAHLWFVSIHPYDDGNGRVSRAIADYILSNDTQDEYKIYSMANAIYAKRVEYYHILDMTTNLHKNRHYDFTLWIEWNLDILINALERSHKNIQFIIKKTKFWDKHKEVKLTKKHIAFLDDFMDRVSRNTKNEFSNQDYRKVTGVSPVTASRHIKKMLECGCIKMIKGKARRNASYAIVFDEEN